MRRQHLHLPDTPEADRLAALARSVRARREELALRQRELADLANVSFATVQSIERAGWGVGIGKILSVLAVLGLDLVVDEGAGRIRARG
jgi:HTH-type transcriptional regulator / antitoxin HipB